MRDDLLPVLACPNCRARLTRTGAGQVGCASGHRFDEAKQGHLTLLPPKRRALASDSIEMVDARRRFLGRGHYAPIADALAGAAAAGAAGVAGTAGTGSAARAVAAGAIAAGATARGVVLDVGSGPGYYLARTLDAMPKRLGLALDLSAVAVRRAARAHGRAGAVVADITERLPLVDGGAAIILDVFAPRNQREYARVLAPGGVLVVVTPKERHLGELEGAVIRVDSEKERRLHDSLTPSFVMVDQRDLSWTMELSADDVHDIVHMGPSHHHLDASQEFAATDVTAAVTVTTWRPAVVL